MSRPLRILACNWRCLRHPQAGGAEVNLFEQARLWVRDGHSVTILSADPGRAHAPERDEVVDGISIRRMGGRFTVYLAVAWFFLMHAQEFDRVLDVANGIPFFTPLFTRRPVTLLVHHVHDRQWFSEFPWIVAVLGRWVERHVVPRVYRHTPIIAVSPSTRDALIESGANADQISVVYNGVVPPAVCAPPPARDVHRVVYVGRIKRYKRLERLIQAVADLRRTFPSIRLDIAGDGDAREELAAMLDRLGLNEHVTLHGFVDEEIKATLLQSAAVFATPSMHEGWGLSVIEANSQGCPAVAYDVPGLRAAVVHEHTGLLAASDALFTQALGRLLGDPVLRNQYAANALAWAARFSWDRCAQETLAIMTDIDLPVAGASGLELVNA